MENRSCDTLWSLYYLWDFSISPQGRPRHLLPKPARNDSRSVLRTARRPIKTRRNVRTHVKSISRSVCLPDAGKATLPQSGAALLNNSPICGRLEAESALNASFAPVSVMGHSRPSQLPPVGANVCYASNSDRSGHQCELTLSAMSRNIDRHDTAGYCHDADHAGTGANMRSLIWIVTVLATVAISGDTLAQSAGPFDGKWTTVVSCPAAEGAESFTLLVDADVIGGVFSGEKGDKDKPGWYSLNGKVQSDGAVEIFARGIVNSSRLAAGNVPVGTAYGYPITADWRARRGPALGREAVPAA